LSSAAPVRKPATTRTATTIRTTTSSRGARGAV
jgi:hypothetical protein